MQVAVGLLIEARRVFSAGALHVHNVSTSPMPMTPTPSNTPQRMAGEPLWAVRGVLLSPKPGFLCRCVLGALVSSVKCDEGSWTGGQTVSVSPSTFLLVTLSRYTLLGARWPWGLVALWRLRAWQWQDVERSRPARSGMSEAGGRGGLGAGQGQEEWRSWLAVAWAGLWKERQINIWGFDAAGAGREVAVQQCPDGDLAPQPTVP